MIKYWLPNDVYDAIKWIVTTLLPKATVAYVALAAIWGWPMANHVERTLVVAYTFLCGVMGISGALAKPVDPDEYWED